MIENIKNNNELEDGNIGTTDIFNKEFVEKEKEVTNIIEIKEELKEQLCKVCFIKDNKLALDFQNYGIEIVLDDNFDKSKIGKDILVKYKSDIGKSDFEVFI